MNRKITAALTVLILVLAAAIVAAPQNARLVDTSTGQVVTNSNLFVESSDNVVNAVVAVETARLDGEDATAGDTAGSDLLIAAGQGTGSADSGDIEFEVAITDEGVSTTLKTREAVARFEGLTGWLSLLKPLEMLEEASTPSNPSTDSWLMYFQSDGLYYLQDDGTEYGPLIDASGAVTDHGALTGLGDDDHPQYLLQDGSEGMTGNWDAGSIVITAERFTSDVSTGTAPMQVSSTTRNTNFNADLLDNEHGSYYLNSANFTGTDWDDLTDAGETTLHTHNHADLNNLNDDDHAQYVLLAGRSSGQQVYGGTAPGDDLTLSSTQNASKGTIIAEDLIDATTGLLIDTGAQLQFDNGADQIDVFPSGTELLIDQDGASMLSVGIDGLDVVVKTGGVTVTAGDITATAGDVLVTAGGVGIGSGAPSAKLHVDNGGTTPSLSARTVLLLQDNVAASDSVGASLVSGTSGYSTILFGDSGQESAGLLRYYNLNDEFQMRAGGSGIDWIMSAAGAVDQEGGLTAGNASNTRWSQTSLLSGVVESGTATLTTSTSAIYWRFSASTSGAVFFQAPESILGSEIKQVRVYLNTSVSSAGTDIDMAVYRSSSTNGALTSVATASHNADSTASTTLTATLGSVYTHGAGTNLYVYVSQDSTLGDAQTDITAVEVLYEEREY